MRFRGVSIKGFLSLLLMVQSGLAQQPPRNSAPTSYDVVSIKLEGPDPGAIGLRYTATGFEAYDVTLADLIKEAYGLPDLRLVKGASEIKLRYHVVAKLSDVDAAALRSLSPEELAAERRLLLQAVLAERFVLAVHHTSGRLPIYSLEVAKQGVKLHEVVPGVDASQPAAGSFFGEGRITGVFSMAQLAHILSLMHKLNAEGSDRTVVDDTGLTGKYAVDLAWTGPSVDRPAMLSSTTEVYGSVNSALEQVGLRLVAKTIDTDSVVVDHVKMPSLD